MRTEYIDLNRTFLDVDEDSDIEGASYKSYLASIDGGTDWQALLQSRYVVVLGEPGSGKTWELEAKAEDLRKAGQHAFFMRIDILSGGVFDTALDANLLEAFRIWQLSEKEGIFFLDSVDEAKLKDSKAFQDALNVFAKGIGSALSRVKLIVSCRYYEWRSSTDKAMFMQRFSIPCEPARKPRYSRLTTSVKSPLFRIVQLAPLDADRIKTLAAHRNCPDVEGFMAAIDYHNLRDFAGRPKDVDSLISYWCEHRCFGTRTEMIEYDINNKLKESLDRENVDPLTADAARQGAQMLAASVVFCHRFNFTIPEDIPEHSRLSDSLTPNEILHNDWTPRQIRALLNRAVFDVALYGRVRFHHRSIAEYLAACWLTDRLKNNCPPHEIESLLFQNSYGREVVIPSRAPLAAWLSIGEDIHHQRIRDKVLRCKPELLLQHGDPEKLPFTTRQTLLKGLVERYEGRDFIRIDTDKDLLRRLAHPDLAPDINHYILEPTTSKDIRELFLRIAWHGKLAGCVEIALQVASQNSDKWLQYYAIKLVCDCGTDEQHTRLATIVSRYREIPQSVCGLICERLFPVYIDVAGFVAVLQQVETIHKRASNHLPDELKELFLHTTSDELLAPLLPKLLILAQEKPRITLENRELPISDRYLWLYEPLQAVVLRLLQRPELGESVSRDVVQAFILFRHFKKVQTFYSSGDEDLDLQTASERHPLIRRAYVWQCIAEYKARNKESRAYLWRIFDHGDHCVLQPSAVDQQWLLKDIGSLPADDARIAMELATDLWSAIDQPAAFRAELKQAACRSRQLAQIFAKGAPNKLQLVFYRIRYRSRFALKRKIKRIPENIQTTWTRLCEHWWLRRHLNELRTGKAVGTLNNMYWEARDHEPTVEYEYGSSRWQALIPKFGEKVAQAVREGWKASWRTNTPHYPFERDSTNSRDGRIILGQIGISTEIVDGLDLASLSPDDAGKLIRYALWETGDTFQQWLEPLANRYPVLVRDALDKCIEAEWHVATDEPYFYGTLNQLENASMALQQLALPKIISLMETDDPTHRDILSQALSFLFDTETAYLDNLARLAAKRIRNYGYTDSYFLVWLIAWLNLDAPKALDFLEALSISRPDETDVLLESLGHVLSWRGNRRMPRLNTPSYQQAVNLRRIIPLCFKHIRPADDIERRSGVYTPTARDDAQEFRGSLLGNLADSKAPDAFSLLQQLLDEPLLESRKDYILHLLDVKAENDAEIAAWKPSDIAIFMRDHEAPPRSTDSLFRIALKRLAIIMDDVEHDDFSQRGDLRPGDQEEKLQLWLARQLEERARDIYKVEREPEVDRKKKPDIRIITAGLGPITIEIKWAHDWSYNNLERALHEQLVGQYMKTIKSRHGILVLATYEAKRQWQQPDGTLINFSQLVDVLQSEARDILKNRLDIDGLEVVGIDFA